MLLRLAILLVIFAATPARAILIADDFTYAGTNGFAASRALATDYQNYHVFETVGVVATSWEHDTTFGTATLLNSEWVLTAAHNWDVRTMKDLEFIYQGKAYFADMNTLNQHPLWLNPPPPFTVDQKGGPSMGWDIALFKLATPVTNSITFPQLYTKSNEFGKPLAIVGAGVIGTGTTPWVGQTNDPALTYASFNVVDRVTSQTYTTNGTNYGGGFLIADFDSATNTAQNTLAASYNTNGAPWVWNPLTNIVTTLDPAGTIVGNDSTPTQFTLGTNIVEGSTGPGDSGGPSFIQDDDGQWKLAGVTSWGFNPWDILANTNTGGRGLYGDVGYMTRVSESSDWIASVIPEPGTYALLGLSVTFFAFALFRKSGRRAKWKSSQSTATFLVFFLTLLAAPLSHAIMIADEFSYAGTNGFAASRALATDYNNFPVFESVGILYGYTNDTLTGYATGTLLNNEWILTAGHNWKPDGATSMEFIIAGKTNNILMSSIIQHPLWINAPPPLVSRQTSPAQGWDIALFKLAAPITNSLVFPKLYTKPNELGKVGIVLGGGMLGTGTNPWQDQSTNPILTPNRVYAAYNVIDRTTTQTNSGYGGGLLVHDFDGSTNLQQNTLGEAYLPGGTPWVWGAFPNRLTTLDPAAVLAGADSSAAQFTIGTNIVEGSVAPGDSGGPTFILDEDGEWKLAGITSWGYNPWDISYNSGSGFRGLYGDVNHTTRVSQTADWITSVIPEPSTTALLTLVAAALSLFGLRRKF